MRKSAERRLTAICCQGQMAEDRLQVFELEYRCNPEHANPIERPISNNEPVPETLEETDTVLPVTLLVTF